jgi:hypothetical protein
MGADACVAVCPKNQHCCVSGPPNDVSIECVDGDECCETSDCDQCATRDNGLCEPDIILCQGGLVACCVDDELICAECCDDPDCDTCHLCHQGRCVPCEAGGLICCEDACVDREKCCVSAGGECGLLQMSSTGGDGSHQLDCCDGLVCCETHHGLVCAECCSHHDCAWGTCCCKDGTCSKHCCEHGCHHDNDCAHGTCCCDDGSCSADCCTTSTPPVSTLPATGSGTEGGSSGLIGAAAIGAAFAAYLAARKLREQSPEDIPAEE